MPEIKDEGLIKMTEEAAQRASAALSKLSGEKVVVKVSKIEVTQLQKEFPGIGPETSVAGIYLPITGEVKGASLLVFPEQVACTLCDVLMKRAPGETSRFTELDKSALKEVGNIICGHFLTIFANALKVKIIEHIPGLSLDMFGAVVDTAIAEFNQRIKEALTIEVKFTFEHSDIKGYIIFIFGLQEMKAIMETLKIVGG